MLQSHIMEGKKQKQLKSYIFQVDEAIAYLEKVKPGHVKAYVYQEFDGKVTHNLKYCKKELEEIEEKERARDLAKVWEALITDSEIMEFNQSPLKKLRKTESEYQELLESEPDIVVKDIPYVQIFFAATFILAGFFHIDEQISLYNQGVKNNLIGNLALLIGGAIWFIFITKRIMASRQAKDTIAQFEAEVDKHPYEKQFDKLMAQNPEIEEHIDAVQAILKL